MRGKSIKKRKIVDTGDRLQAAWEYCRPGGICIPNNQKLERSLKQCKKFNVEHPIPYREEIYAREKEARRRGVRRFRERHGKEPEYILNGRIRGLITGALKKRGSGLRGRHWEDLVGYKLEELEKRLRFTLKKLNKRSDRVWTWQDFLDGKLWIDHIIPVSIFNFTKPENEDFKRCWALKNLQLLPVVDNIKKGAKLSKPIQPTFALEI